MVGAIIQRGIWNHDAWFCAVLEVWEWASCVERGPVWEYVDNEGCKMDLGIEYLVDWNTTGQTCSFVGRNSRADLVGYLVLGRELLSSCDGRGRSREAGVRLTELDPLTAISRIVIGELFRVLEHQGPLWWVKFGMFFIVGAAMEWDSLRILGYLGCSSVKGKEESRICKAYLSLENCSANG